MAQTTLTPEHLDFYERFKSFWAAPSGARVVEIIGPEARIHFTGQATISGAEYIEYMDGMLAAFPGMAVEEHIVFDSAVLSPEGRPGIDDQ